MGCPGHDSIPHGDYFSKADSFQIVVKQLEHDVKSAIVFMRKKATAERDKYWTELDRRGKNKNRQKVDPSPQGGKPPSGRLAKGFPSQRLPSYPLFDVF